MMRDEEDDFHNTESSQEKFLFLFFSPVGRSVISLVIDQLNEGQQK